jgi:hypothetical protein
MFSKLPSEPRSQPGSTHGTNWPNWFGAVIYRVFRVSQSVPYRHTVSVPLVNHEMNAYMPWLVA